jgi:hypothetical protein
VRRLAVVLLVGVALATSGCLDIEETITLNRNMSGQAGFLMHVDMEPVVVFMAQMQRQLTGQSGPPTASELAATRAELLKNANGQSDFEKDKRDMENHLPPGVKLLGATYTPDGLKSTASALFSFDNAAALKQLVFDDQSSSSQSADQGPGNPVSKPFDGFQVVDDGRTVLITSAIADPMTNAKQQMQQTQLPPAMAQQFAAMFKDLRVVVRITAPFQVLEQNATRKEGNTLVWEFDSARLQAMTPDQAAHGIRVRYRK